MVTVALLLAITMLLWLLMILVATLVLLCWRWVGRVAAIRVVALVILALVLGRRIVARLLVGIVGWSLVALLRSQFGARIWMRRHARRY
jgi:hypothetical protein